MIKQRSLQQLGFLLICLFTVSCSEQESSTTSNVAQNGSEDMMVRDTPVSYTHLTLPTILRV